MNMVNSFAVFIRTNITEISFGITAVILMLSGRPVNSVVKKFTQTMHWFLRYCIYVLLCTLGYGFLSTMIYQGFRNWFLSLSNPALVLWVPSVYLILAWFAKAQKEI